GRAAAQNTRKLFDMAARGDISFFRPLLDRSGKNRLVLSKPVGNEAAQLFVMWRHFKRGVDQKTAPPFAVVHRSLDDLLNETADGLLWRQGLFESLDPRPRREMEITIQRLDGHPMRVAASIVETWCRGTPFVSKITHGGCLVGALPEALDRRL